MFTSSRNRKNIDVMNC